MPVIFGRYPRVAVLLCLSAACCFREVRAADASLRERLLHSAVRIQSERSAGSTKVTGHGTAFAVDMSKWGYAGPQYLLSAAHNALDENDRPYPTLKVEIEKNERAHWSRCRVVAFDKDFDLCLLEAEDAVPQQSVLAAGDAEVGQSVILAGSPRGIPLALYEGTLTKRFAGGTERSSACLPFDHGCSGGPFFNAKGEVIGVAVAGVAVAGVAVAGAPKDDDMDKSIGLFVPLVGVTSFLESNRAGRTHAGGAASSLPPQAEVMREHAVTVTASSTLNRPKTAEKNSPPRVEMDNAVRVSQLPTATAPSVRETADSAARVSGSAAEQPKVASPTSPQ